jgi:glycosyltransferase involved in cell wall biosynthesis
MTPRPPRILHLFANFKWTGPADPAIRTAVHLRELGADVVFAQAGWLIPGAEHRMRAELKRFGLPVVAGLELRKHFHLRSHLRDAKQLARRLDAGDFDILHSHQRADHLIAALAARRARRRVSVVRTLYEPRAPRRGWREMLSMRWTDVVVAPTRACAAETAARFSLPPSGVLYQEPPTEPVPSGGSDLRGELGLAAGDLVVGITARIQPHRRFELLWEVVRAVVDRQPRARFVLLGRGNANDVRRLVREPIERLSLQRFVRLPGYLYHADYDRALRSLDVFLFLVPGSDGTCRAVREAMAHGLPVVASGRGILPTLLGPDPGGIAPDAAGIVCAEDAAALAGALLGLLEDADRRARLGDAARTRVRRAMDPLRAARELMDVYARLAAESR